MEPLKRSEEFGEVWVAGKINGFFLKAGYPRCLEDLDRSEIAEVCGWDVLTALETDKQWARHRTGTMAVLMQCKGEKKLHYSKIFLRCDERYQLEMIRRFGEACLVMPDKLLHKCVHDQMKIDQMARRFGYPISRVKFRLIFYFFKNVILRMENALLQMSEAEDVSELHAVL